MLQKNLGPVPSSSVSYYFHDSLHHLPRSDDDRSFEPLTRTPQLPSSEPQCSDVFSQEVFP